MKKTVLFYIFLCLNFIMSDLVVANTYTIISNFNQDNAIVYINGFPFYLKKNDLGSCTQSIKSKDNEIIVIPPVQGQIKIMESLKKNDLREIFSYSFGKNDSKPTRLKSLEYIRKEFYIENIDYDLVWTHSEVIKILTEKDKLNILETVKHYVNAYKKGSFDSEFDEYMKYYFKNRAFSEHFAIKKAHESFRFLYDNFLSPSKRLKWLESDSDIVIRKSPFNPRLVVVSRKDGTPIFSIKTPLKDYTKYFVCFIKINKKWFVQ